MEGAESPQLLSVRRATPTDLDAVMAVIDAARAIMRATGNLTQWPVGYPSRTMIEHDIASGNFYIICDANGTAQGCFAFISGPDPTYARIEGAWLNDKPYGVIHRLASKGEERGVADACLDFCLAQTDVIRIDTHADNRPMLRWLKKRGFIHCGVIHIADGSPREAFMLDRSHE